MLDVFKWSVFAKAVTYNNVCMCVCVCDTVV